MNIVEIIEKKKKAMELSEEEINFFIEGMESGELADYQVSALLMAIVLKGMSKSETSYLTSAMLKSGDIIDLSGIEGIKADKHSSGGVGDKTSIAIVPLLASCGIKMAKLSGRGLGFTGGTLDKLMSFKGFNSELSEERFIEIVNKYGLAIASQTQNLVPADKKLYALRDVTGTVDSIPLIASSIMSKKLAAGADIISLDVKCGEGALMKNLESARELAGEMVEIGKRAGKQCSAFITDMSEPLGYMVGNALEVKEAIDFLKGEAEPRFYALCMALCAETLVAAGLFETEKEAEKKLEENIKNGSALKKLRQMVAAQGGDTSSLDDSSVLITAPVIHEVLAEEEGFISRIEADSVGLIAMELGGGRAKKDDEIDLRVGIEFNKKCGYKVQKGDLIAKIHARDLPSAERAEKRLRAAINISAEPVELPPIILDRVL